MVYPTEDKHVRSLVYHTDDSILTKFYVETPGHHELTLQPTDVDYRNLASIATSRPRLITYLRAGWFAWRSRVLISDALYDHIALVPGFFDPIPPDMERSLCTFSPVHVRPCLFPSVIKYRTELISSPFLTLPLT